MKIRPCWFALALFASATAQAEFYLGAGAGGFHTQSDAVETQASFKGILGIRGGQQPFFAELTGIGTRAAQVSSLNGVALSGATEKVQGLAGYIGLRAPLDDHGSGIFLKGGYYNSRVRLSNANARVQEKGDGLAYGLGAEWFPIPGLAAMGLRGDLEVYDNVDDFQQNENITFAHVSLLLAIGGGDGQQRIYGVKRERNPYRYYWDE